PCSRIDVPLSGGCFFDRRAMSVAHYHGAERWLLGHGGACPGGLSPVGGLNLFRMCHAVVEVVSQAIGDPESDIRVQSTVDGNQPAGGGRLVHPFGTATFFMQSVAVDDQHAALVEVQREAGRGEPDAGVLLPERVAPAVVVAAHERDRNPAGEGGQRSGHAEVAAGNQVAVTEPVVVDVANHYQGVG